MGHLRTLSYLFKARPFALEKPLVLQFPVIDICNSRCQMCRIWENHKSDDITPEQLRRGLRNPLFSEVEGVGLNGGEPTLRKDLAQLAAVLFEELPRLRSISLITNGYKTEEVTERIAEVGEVVRRHGGVLDVMVSLDGVGAVHDAVRGRPGNFERACKVIDFARASPLVHHVRIGCTIIRENVWGLADLLAFCQSRDLYVKFRLGIPHQRLYTGDLRTPYALDEAERYHVTEFLEGLVAHYEPGEQQRHFYRSLIGQIMHGRPRSAGCDWQHRGATISARGELSYCAVQSRSLGCIQDADSEQLYFGNEAHLRDIVDNRCATCVHDYVGIPPRAQYAKQLGFAALRRVGLDGPVRALYHAPAVRRLPASRAFAARRDALAALAAAAPPRADVRQRPQVLVCGWYGTETLGDKAILGGLVLALREALGGFDLTLVSLHPYVSRMTVRQMPELAGCRIVTPEEGVVLAGASDLVVFGGGPLMAVDPLADMEALFAAARARGVPAWVAGCGVGPLGEPWHDASIGRLLALATRRIFRDAPSRDAAVRLGAGEADDAVTEDPAFTWLRHAVARLAPPAAPDRPVLLLGLRDFPADEYAKHLRPAERQAVRARYEAAVVAALETLVQRHPDLVVQPLPMCTNHFGSDDRWFYRRLLGASAVLRDRLDTRLLGAECAPDDYVQAFRGASVALTMRFHALVFALGLGTPAVAIDYTLGRGKVHALAQRYDTPARDLGSLDADFLVREIERQLGAPRRPLPAGPDRFTAAIAAAAAARPAAAPGPGGA